MARGNEGQALSEYGKRKKQYRRRRALIIITLFLIIVVATGNYLYRLFNKRYDSYQVMKSITNMDEITSDYISYNSEVVKYNKDGAIAIEKNGNTIWNGAYEMANPIADTCGKYVVIADRGNRKVCVFDGAGVASRFSTLHNIVKVDVASQGVVAVQMEEGEVNYITVYEKDGTEIVKIKKNINEVGYLLDISLSEDGKKLVASFLSVESGKMIGYLGFFNFGEVGKNYTDRLVGGYDLEDVIIPKVAFLSNNRVCIYKDNGLILYSFIELPQVIAELPKLNQSEKVEKKIKSVLYNSKYAGIVWDGEDGKQDQLVLYDTEGNKILDKSLKFDYSQIYISEDEIIMKDNTSCVILKTNGKEKFRYTFDSNVEAFYPINHLDRYYLINSAEISDIKLTE